MKKVAFLCCLFCGLITQAIGATYNCRPQNLSSRASKRSNEYLFIRPMDNFDNIALVCGDKGTDGCKHGTIVNVGGHHYYGDVEIEHAQMYRCDTPGGASWVPMSRVELDKCANTDGLVFIPSVDWAGYDIYVPRTGLKVEDLWYAVLDEEPCYVRTTSITYDQFNSLIDMANASETKSGQGASSSDTSAQNQSIDTGTSLKQSQTSRVRALTQKIKNAASQLDSISSNFKVSGWKDAEGKFNTARLASDSIAGVVLGTAGGLITSHVVKKNQVENGFQDIKCTIGGQSVANWGDEFSVGIQ